MAEIKAVFSRTIGLSLAVMMLALAILGAKPIDP
jgi:hypothetical protein